MSERTPARLVIIALISSISLAALALTGASWTGAAVMMAVTVQALVGASHQALLLARTRQQHSVLERDLFASFVVPILLYGLGSGVALSQGIAALTSERTVVSPLLDVLCLALALGICCASLVVSLALVQTPGDATAVAKPKTSAIVKTVLIEHTGHLASLLIGCLAIACLILLELTTADGAAALAVGLVMALVAAAMALEVKKSIEDRTGLGAAPADSSPHVTAAREAPADTLAKSDTAASEHPQPPRETAQLPANPAPLSRKERRRQKRRS